MKLTNLEKENLIKDYLDGATWNELCSKYRTNTNTIHKILTKNNISKNRIQENSWSKEKQALFIDMYTKNCTYQEMYKALNCKGGTLTYWVHKLNLPMRGSGRNNNYPNKFLEGSPESDYWLGYIFADGHVNYVPKKGRGEIYLCSEKEEVVLKFKKWYDNIPSISRQKYILKDGTVKYLYKAIICDTNIAKWFRTELNVENKKHHTLNPNCKINWDIIRGFFDGDGSSSKGEWQLKSCSKIWLERIKKYIDSFNIETLLKISYLDCWGLFAYKKSEALKIATLMYSNKYYCHEYKYNNFFEPCTSNSAVKTE
jgi:hypothetical protein